MANFDLSKYDTVADRIKQFRADYPKGAILTRIVPELSTFNEVVCEAEIWLDLNDPRPVARDLAAEWKGENFRAGANFTAWHENAATSAIGRALDAAGYSKNKQPGTRATQDEMGKADRVGSNRPAQEAKPELRVVTPEQIEAAEEASAWVRFVEAARANGCTFTETRELSALAKEMTKSAQGLPADERYLMAAGELSAMEWESAINAVKAKLQANSTKAATA